MKITDLRQRIADAAIVPILMAGDSDIKATISAADRLVEAGYGVIEVLFRNANAAAALAGIKRRHPDVLLAAGTILDSEGARLAEAAGADLMVSPGFSPHLHAAAQSAGIPLVPGVNTASEVQRAREQGYLLQKFYPAWDHGHQRLEEFSVIYPDVRFLVTGGLVSSSVAEFAHHTNIAALGGTWMVESDTTAAQLTFELAQFRAARGNAVSGHAS